MYKETKSYTIPLTPTVLSEFMKIRRWAGERDIRRDTMSYLRAQYDCGKFRTLEWSVARMNGDLYRMNGQHSSIVLSEIENEDPGAIDRLGVNVHMNEYLCENSGDLHDLFQTFDRHGGSRTPRDLIRVTMSSHSNLSDILPTTALRLVNGMCSYYNGGKGYGGVKATERVYYVNEDPAFIFDAEVYARWRMYHAGVGAALYATWLSSKADLDIWRDFWDAVISESDPDAESPSRVLARYLVETKKPGTKRNTRAIYVRSIHAWNAYRDGRKTKLRYYSNKPLPSVR